MRRCASDAGRHQADEGVCHGGGVCFFSEEGVLTSFQRCNVLSLVFALLEPGTSC